MIDDRSGRVIVEKMSRLIRNAYKTVAYGLKHHTVNQRLLQSAYKFDTHYDELSKVAAEVNELTCPKKIEEAIRVLQMGHESGALLDKLIDDYTHFKLHEEPNLTASNMLRDIALPCSAGAGLTFLLGVIAYDKKMKEDCQELERQLSTLEREHSALERELRELSTLGREQSTLERDRSALERDISALKRDISALKNELSAGSAN